MILIAFDAVEIFDLVRFDMEMCGFDCFRCGYV